MQWNNQKNHGFSESDTPYLPSDNRVGAPTVADQEENPQSVLSFVKWLIELHKKDRRLLADSQLRILLRAYPFVYERGEENNKLFIAINPSERRYYI